MVLAATFIAAARKWESKLVAETFIAELFYPHQIYKITLDHKFNFFKIKYQNLIAWVISYMIKLLSSISISPMVHAL